MSRIKSCLSKMSGESQVIGKEGIKKAAGALSGQTDDCENNLHNEVKCWILV